VRLPSSTESLESLPAHCLAALSTFPGVSCPIAALPAESTFAEPHFRSAPRRGHPKPASFRPRRFSRPRRFAPPPTLRACFIPQPRPGFALQGFPLTSSRSGSSPDLALWSFLLIRCPPVLSIGLHEPAPASRALLHLRVRCAPRWFRPRPARSPPELVLPRVFLRRP